MWYWDFSADSGLDARLDEARRWRFLGYARNDVMWRSVHEPPACSLRLHASPSLREGEDSGLDVQFGSAVLED